MCICIISPYYCLLTLPIAVEPIAIAQLVIDQCFDYVIACGFICYARHITRLIIVQPNGYFLMTLFLFEPEIEEGS